MSSKLDLLSKFYGQGNNNDDDDNNSTGGKKKHRKKHKKKKHKHEKQQHGGMIVKDEDDDHLGGATGTRNDNGDDHPDDDNDDEDGPVVVKTEEFVQEVQSNHHTRTRPRYDSSEDESDNHKNENRQLKAEDEPVREGRRRRLDSSEDENEETSRKVARRHDSSSEEDGEDNVARTSSGHKAGLRTGSDFAKDEAKIQKERQKESQNMVDQHGMGETVHRRSRDKSNTKNTFVLDKEEQRKLNTGSAQQKQQELAKAQFSQIQQSAFARGKDDAGINDERRNMIRAGDPMAHRQQARSTQTKSSSHQKSQRPIYKGPPVKPNRFGIRPGFRWDGNDRGNGFEDKLLSKMSSAVQQKEDAYRWGASGM